MDSNRLESSTGLSTLIAPEIKNDDLYFAIRRLASEEQIRTVLEIGSSAGGGSTEAFVEGLKSNVCQPQLFCMELSKERFQALRQRYQGYSFVHCYNVSSVPVDRFPAESEVSRFYAENGTALNCYPLETVLGWLRQDINYVRDAGVPDNGIQLIKKENGIDKFDLVLIDGSEFTGVAELEEVYGAKYLLLDDVNSYKNRNNYSRLSIDPSYQLIAENWQLRNGYAIFKRKVEDSELKIVTAKELPIHFFTIVLNGEPFIRHHISEMQKLPFKWHWHIMEGVADLKHDTSWSLRNGGRIDDNFHRGGLSNDGTSEYLDQLVRWFPDQVTVYRRPPGEFWEGKLEMVNAPLANVHEECLLWQVDVDEIWTAEQIAVARQLFMENPTASAAHYYCIFFVGPDLVTTTVNTFGNYTEYGEWLRTWRFKPGDRWDAHEPPRLHRFNGAGEGVDVARINPLKQNQTGDKGLIFRHYAYATEEQLRFKEVYYGYQGAVARWKELQNVNDFPVMLRDYFPWVRDGAQVDRIEGCELPGLQQKSILWVRTDAIGDNVLASTMLPHLRKLFPDARITVLCQDRVVDLYSACPLIDDIIAFNWLKAFHEDQYRNEILAKVRACKPDLTLNSVYSREMVNDFFSLGSYATERIAFNGDLSNISAETRDKDNAGYTKILHSNPTYRPELERHRDFLEGIGIKADKLESHIWLTAEDEQFADDLFRVNQFDPTRTIILFAAGNWAGKFYEHYPEVLEELCRDHGLSVIALGGEKDFEVNQWCLDALSCRTLNLSGRTQLRQSAAIIKRCRLAVGADTGTAHIACAVSIPNVVVLWGGHFGRFFPYSPLTSVVCLPLECYGCNWKCPHSRPHCVKDISPQLLKQAIYNALSGGSEKPRLYAQGYDDWRPAKGEPAWSLPDEFLDLRSVEIVPVQLSCDYENYGNIVNHLTATTG